MNRGAVQETQQIPSSGMRQKETFIPTTPREVPRILLVDDHPMLLHGLRSVLIHHFNAIIVGECSSAKDALTTLRNTNPSLVITDISLPGSPNGLELIKCMRSEYPSLRIMVLSVHDEILYGMRAIAAGAKGYSMKNQPLQEILGLSRFCGHL